MKIAKALLLILGMVFIIHSCTDTSQTIKPVNFPQNLGISGFNFPEDSTKIYGWLEKQDTTSIVSHAWGIWAGLTQPTEQKYNGQTLLVFETWMGVQELSAMSANGQVTGDIEKTSRTALSVPKQFIHGQLVSVGNKPIDTNFVVLETVHMTQPQHILQLQMHFSTNHH